VRANGGEGASPRAPPIQGPDFAAPAHYSRLTAVLSHHVHLLADVGQSVWSVIATSPPICRTRHPTMASAVGLIFATSPPMA
jgi:hypothetical protein